jgi:hypothetical protein
VPARPSLALLQSTPPPTYELNLLRYGAASRGAMVKFFVFSFSRKPAEYQKVMDHFTDQNLHSWLPAGTFYPG